MIRRLLMTACGCLLASPLFAQTPSPDGTIPPAAIIYDCGGHYWQLEAGTQYVYRDGTSHGTGVKIVLSACEVYKQHASLLWSRWQTDAWVESTAPVGPTPPSPSVPNVTIGTLFGWDPSPLTNGAPTPDGYKFCIDGVCGAGLGPVLQTAMPSTLAGPHDITVVAYTAGVESGPSNIVKIYFVLPPVVVPNPPGNLHIL